MEKRLKSLKTLSAKIEMEKYNVQLDESDKIEGTFIFMSGKSSTDFSARIDWERPVVENISVIKNEYILFRPRLNQVIIGKLSNMLNRPNLGNVFGFFNLSAAQLKESYSFRILGEKKKLKNGIKTTHLELTPKNPTIYRTAEIWIDKKGLPIQIKVTEKNRDTTTVLLKEFKRNKKIDLKRFAISYPKNTRIIRG